MKLFRFALMATAAAGIVFAGVSVGEAKGPMRFFDLTFPSHMAGSKLERHHDFEKRRPGLGHGVEYGAPGWKINVYIYDLKKKQIPDDPNSNEITAQLRQAEGDIFAGEKRGVYANVRMVRAYTLSDLSRRARLRCMTFALEHSKAGALDSFLCLTGWRGKFVKFRISTGRKDDSEAMVRQYLGAWIAHLWPKQ